MQCSKSCGGGIQVRSAYCIDSDDNILEEENCFSLTPVTKQDCGNEECPKWKTGDWTAVISMSNLLIFLEA